MLGLFEITELANHVLPYSKILKDGNLLDKTNNLEGYFDRFLDFLTNASLLSNYLKIVEFG